MMASAVLAAAGSLQRGADAVNAEAGASCIGATLRAFGGAHRRLVWSSLLATARR